MKKVLLVLVAIATTGLLQAQNLIEPIVHEENISIEKIKELYGEGIYSYDNEDQEHSLKYKVENDSILSYAKFTFKEENLLFWGSTVALKESKFYYHYKNYDIKENDWTFDHYREIPLYSYTQIDGTAPGASLSLHEQTWKNNRNIVKRRISSKSNWDSSLKKYTYHHSATINVKYSKY